MSRRKQASGLLTEIDMLLYRLNIHSNHKGLKAHFELGHTWVDILLNQDSTGRKEQKRQRKYGN